MRQLFLCLTIFCAIFTVAQADDNQAEDKASAPLGFEMEKVPPPDPAKGKPIARVFYDYIYPEDIAAEWKAEPGGRATAFGLDFR